MQKSLNYHISNAAYSHGYNRKITLWLHETRQFDHWIMRNFDRSYIHIIHKRQDKLEGMRANVCSQKLIIKVCTCSVEAIKEVIYKNI